MQINMANADEIDKNLSRVCLLALKPEHITGKLVNES